MGFLFTGEALEIIAAIVSATATALGGAAAAGVFEKLSQLLSKSSFYRKVTHASGKDETAVYVGTSFTIDSAPSPSQLIKPQPKVRTNIARGQVLVRIKEARSAKNKQQRLAWRMKWSANSLTFGQYVIGGIMATSFMQKKLSPDVIGVFGVIVVVASIFKQYYHPDNAAQTATQRMLQLETLVRQSEDRLIVIQTTADADIDDPAPVLELLERVSAEISRIIENPIVPVARATTPTRRAK